ncbi:MAG: YigZ family protein [Candidatus Eisenbacteria bacterium]|nr:YigZ family protein [Candidatus Eisenbacteria bacterium]
MTRPTRYMIPAAVHRVEETIRRSRFITTVGPASTDETARDFIAEIAREFRDATHNCWAYCLGPPGDTSRIGMSDAGEPHGTAGRPILTVLETSDVGDIAAVVTRYYGGVKLGKGGLVRAYGGGVRAALESLRLVELVPRATLTVTLDYASAEAVRRALPDHEAEVVDEKYGTEVVLIVRLPLEMRTGFERTVAGMSNGRAVIRELPPDVAG